MSPTNGGSDCDFAALDTLQKWTSLPEKRRWFSCDYLQVPSLKKETTPQHPTFVEARFGGRGFWGFLRSLFGFLTSHEKKLNEKTIEVFQELIGKIFGPSTSKTLQEALEPLKEEGIPLSLRVVKDYSNQIQKQSESLVASFNRSRLKSALASPELTSTTIQALLQNDYPFFFTELYKQVLEQLESEPAFSSTFLTPAQINASIRRQFTFQNTQQAIEIFKGISSQGQIFLVKQEELLFLLLKDNRFSQEKLSEEAIREIIQLPDPFHLLTEQGSGDAPLKTLSLPLQAKVKAQMELHLLAESLRFQDVDITLEIQKQQLAPFSSPTFSQRATALYLQMALEPEQEAELQSLAVAPSSKLRSRYEEARQELSLFIASLEAFPELKASLQDNNDAIEVQREKLNHSLRLSKEERISYRDNLSRRRQSKALTIALARLEEKQQAIFQRLGFSPNSRYYAFLSSLDIENPASSSFKAATLWQVVQDQAGPIFLSSTKTLPKSLIGKKYNPPERQLQEQEEIKRINAALPSQSTWKKESLTENEVLEQAEYHLNLSAEHRRKTLIPYLPRLAAFPFFDFIKIEGAKINNGKNFSPVNLEEQRDIIIYEQGLLLFLEEQVGFSFEEAQKEKIQALGKIQRDLEDLCAQREAAHKQKVRRVHFQDEKEVPLPPTQEPVTSLPFTEHHRTLQELRQSIYDQATEHDQQDHEVIQALLADIEALLETLSVEIQK